MNSNNIPFQMVDWNAIPKTTAVGISGTAQYQTLQFGGFRVRLVEYSKGYHANHWCQKGHIVHCLEGEFVSVLKSGKRFSLSKGMSYIVSDDASSHQSLSPTGVKLLIIDGDFLKPEIH